MGTTASSGSAGRLRRTVVVAAVTAVAALGSPAVGPAPALASTKIQVVREAVHSASPQETSGAAGLAEPPRSTSGTRADGPAPPVTRTSRIRLILGSVGVLVVLLLGIGTLLGTLVLRRRR